MNLIYETKRLILRAEHQNAAPQILAFYNNNKSYFEPYEITRPDNFYSLSYQTIVLSFEYNQFIKNQAFRFWLYEKENTDIPIGCVSASNIRKGAFLSCDMAYKIDHQKQNQGYATEACQKLMELLKCEMHLHRITLHIMPSNKASLQLAKKLQFQYEGMEYAYAQIKDNWEDHLRYSYLCDN